MAISTIVAAMTNGTEVNWHSKQSCKWIVSSEIWP